MLLLGALGFPKHDAQATEALSTQAEVRRPLHAPNSAPNEPSSCSDASPLAPGARAATEALGDPIANARTTLRHLQEGHFRLDASHVAQLTDQIEDLRVLWELKAERGLEIAEVLLDIAGNFLLEPSPPTAERPGAGFRAAALEVLRAHLDRTLLDWFAAEVLVSPRTHPLNRRLAAIEVLATRAQPLTKLALVSCAREGNARLREAALGSLAGWDDDAVNSVFLEAIERVLKGEREPGASWAEDHFRRIRLDAKSRVHAPYIALVRDGLVSPNWRAASRAVVLTRPLENESVMPFLIEALATWKNRADSGAQALRLEFEIERALRERAGVAFGFAPEKWRAWWTAVRQGKLRLGGPTTDGRPMESTRAGFFGLKPMTDRVVFVIDRSGSMTTGFTGPESAGRGDTMRTRWDEAIEQLGEFLDNLGETGRFDVVLFHSGAEAWKGELVPATKANLRSLRDWLRVQKPNGGTSLRSGIDLALHVGPAGLCDLSTLEADTVIVLCDGATNEGPGWIEGFLAEANALARIVIHSVQVGDQGDGALEALAKGSGGQFVKVGG